MGNRQIDSYETLILGLSHAEVGVIPEMLAKPTLNLAVGGADLFYNYAALEYTLRKYYEKIKNIKNVVIDLFDYTYFNYDTSLASNAPTYFIKSGGILIKHHFDENKNIKINFDTLVNNLEPLRINGISSEHIDVWKKIVRRGFWAEYPYGGFKNKPYLETRRKKYVPTEANIHDFLNSGIINKVHEGTISENLICFENILKTLTEINPDIKIHLMILPQYYLATANETPTMHEWKTFFYNTLETFGEKYSFQIWDLKNCAISEASELFADVDHLNYEGATIFTQTLDEIINNY